MMLTLLGVADPKCHVVKTVVLAHLGLGTLV